MSPNANAPSNIPAGITEIELWIQLIVFLGIIGGVVSTAGNLAIVIGILRSKKLRSRFFVILWFLAMARALTSSQTIVTVAYRTLRTLNIADMMVKRISCYLIHLNAYYSLTLEVVFLLGLVIDRCLAILAYRYYSTLTYRQAIKACTIASVVTIMVKVVPSFLGVDVTAVIPCVNMISPLIPAYANFHTNVDLVITIMMLSIYLWLMWYVRFRFLPAANSSSLEGGDQTAFINFNRQANLLRLIRQLVLMHCGVTLVTRAGLGLLTFVPPLVAVRLSTYNSMLVVLENIFDIAVVLISDKDVRKAAVPCFVKVVSDTTVVQVSVQAGRRINVQLAG